jgi:hypothetical protein
MRPPDQQTSALLLGAFFICAIMFTAWFERSNQTCRSQLSRMSIGPGNCLSLNIHNLGKLLSEMGGMSNFWIHPIMIGDIDHNISMQLSSNHFINLIDREATPCRDSCVRTNELRSLNNFFWPLVEYRPWLLEFICGTSAFDKKYQISCGGIPAICQRKNEINSHWIDGARGEIYLGQGRIDKGSLRNNIIISCDFVGFLNKSALPIREPSSRTRNKERRYGDGSSKAIITMLVGALFTCAGVWWGGRGHDFLGWCAILSGGFAVAFGTYSLCVFLLRTPRPLRCFDASAPTYRRAKDRHRDR